MLLLVCRRIKLQPDLDELIKQLGGPAPPPLPRGQVSDNDDEDDDDDDDDDDDGQAIA